MVLRCILSVIFHLSGFRCLTSPTYGVCVAAFSKSSRWRASCVLRVMCLLQASPWRPLWTTATLYTSRVTSITWCTRHETQSGNWTARMTSPSCDCAPRNMKLCVHRVSSHFHPVLSSIRQPIRPVSWSDLIFFYFFYSFDSAFIWSDISVNLYWCVRSVHKCSCVGVSAV